MPTKEQIQAKRQFPSSLVDQRADPWIYKHTDGYFKCPLIGEGEAVSE
jgi:GH43 family beta-xylosidase